ncbi:MAG: hypothetical protein PHP62_03965 [Candidatus Moranbacteria bacterium]|nr:hypothetical protein [Candidatus Moranbacteria bacterium]
MKRIKFKQEISCENMVKYFPIFQQFIDRQVGIVLVPFFHVLFVKFIMQMQDGCGNFYETTDFTEYERLIKEQFLEYTESVFTFVYNGKIVEIQTNRRSLLEHLPFSDVFKVVCAIDIESRSKDAIAKVIEYFEDFIRQQDFEEIKKEAVEMISANPKAKKVFTEIREFYL